MPPHHNLLPFSLLPLLTLLTTLTTALPHPGADPLASAYAFALSRAQTDPTNDPNAHNSNPGDYDQSSNYGTSGGVDTAGGASGADHGSFKLSNGAIAGIAVVCALVVIFGVASSILFYLAKKRQWQVRKSIRRASRRVTAKMTGKPGAAKAESEAERRSRRQGAMRLKEEYKRDRGLGVSSETGLGGAPRDDDREKLVGGKKGGRVQTQAVEMGMMDLKQGRERGDGRKVGVVMPPGHGGR